MAASVSYAGSREGLVSEPLQTEEAARVNCALLRFIGPDVGKLEKLMLHPRLLKGVLQERARSAQRGISKVEKQLTRDELAFVRSINQVAIQALKGQVLRDRDLQLALKRLLYQGGADFVKRSCKANSALTPSFLKSYITFQALFSELDQADFFWSRYEANLEAILPDLARLGREEPLLADYLKELQAFDEMASEQQKSLFTQLLENLPKSKNQLMTLWPLSSASRQIAIQFLLAKTITEVGVLLPNVSSRLLQRVAVPRVVTGDQRKAFEVTQKIEVIRRDPLAFAPLELSIDDRARVISDERYLAAKKVIELGTSYWSQILSLKDEPPVKKFALLEKWWKELSEQVERQMRALRPLLVYDKELPLQAQLRGRWLHREVVTFFDNQLDGLQTLLTTVKCQSVMKEGQGQLPEQVERLSKCVDALKAALSPLC